MSAAAKVGIFVVLILAILGFLILKVEDLQLGGGGDTKEIAAMFDEITKSDYDDLESPFAGITDEDIDSLFS